MLAEAALLLLLLLTARPAGAVKTCSASCCHTVTACNETFDSLDRSCFATTNQARARDSLVPVLPYVAVAALCPARCLSDAGAAAVGVFGSFPYHARSSVCLAAIHAGVISDEAGGGAFISRFHRQDWSGAASQSVFPFSSWRGSVSNGVRSSDVGPDWYALPSSDFDFSYTVRGRGDFVAQRRQAPWPARAGHVHVSTNYAGPGVVNATARFTLTVHLIIGGYNSSHYLNSVWLGLQPRGEAGSQYADVSWLEMADAPFSPRADMLVLPPSRQRAEGGASLFIIAGQTAHRCGLRELGVCSSEVWRLDVTVREDGSPSAEWSSAPVSQLPFSPRCSMGFGYYDALQLSFLGGQLSYTAPCSAAASPVSVNDVWHAAMDSWSGAILPDLTSLEPGPFSPRRLDAAAVGQADAVFYVRPLVFGGIRHVNLTLSSRRAEDGEPQLRLAGSEVYADVWRCNGMGRLMSGALKCGWQSSGAPDASLAVPVASAPQQPSASGYGGLSFGGVIPRAAIQTWLQTLPLLDDLLDADLDASELAVNISVVAALNAVLAQSSWGLSMIMDARLQMPLAVSMAEDELNDPAGAYVLGSDWVVGYLDWINRLGASSTLHRQRLAFASTPAEASWTVPQAASSLHSSRPLFNFALPRLQHRQLSLSNTLYSVRPQDAVADSSWATGTAVTIVSGGESGGVQNSDWIVRTPPRCLPPTDPSYAAALGPVQVAEQFPPYVTYIGDYPKLYAGSYLPASRLPVYCPPGFHVRPQPADAQQTAVSRSTHRACAALTCAAQLEPPSLQAEAIITCSPSALWMGYDVRTVRRCVRDRLNCSGLLVDLGANDCEPLLPLISQLQASYSFNRSMRELSAADAVTLTGMPANAQAVLTVSGSLFLSSNLEVLVGGRSCTDPRLLPEASSDPPLLCYNVSFAQHQKGLQCDRWSRAVSCQLPLEPGVQLPVTVRTGRWGALSEVDPRTGRQLATVSSLPPVISLVSADGADCRSRVGALHLSECSITRPFPLQLCLQADSAQQAATLAVFLGDLQLPLNCSVFSLDAQSLDICTSCQVLPRLGQALRLRVEHSSLLLVSDEDASLSFQQCPAGYRTDAAAALLGTATSLCVPCPAGSSTDGNSAQRDCQPCRSGFFSNSSGQASCSPCPHGRYAAAASSTGCSLCPLNSYQNSTAQSRCEVCELNEYIVYSAAGGAGRVAGDCRPCPASATCTADGDILAASGSFLVVDQQAGTVSAVACSHAACLDAAACSAEEAGQTIASSSLRVVNCCAAGRWPAFSLAPTDAAIRAAQGHNVLCASCLPGHSAVNGHCIACPGVQWAALSGLLLLALGLVYLVHRLPADHSGAATVLILAFLLQQSTIFLTADSLPQLMSLFSVELLGGGGSRGADSVVGYGTLCVLPLSEQAGILLSLLSPLLALCLLAVVAALQLACQAAAQRYGSSAQARSTPARVRCLQRFCTLLFLQPAAASADSESGSGSEDRRPLRLCSRSDSLVELEEPLQPRTQAAQCADSAAPTETAAGPTCISFPPASRLVCLYQRSCLRLVQLSYSGVAYLTMSFFYQQSVGPLGWRLVEYPTLSPDSAAYRLLLLPVMLTALLLLVLGWPLFLLLFLLRQRRAGEVQRLKALQQQDVSSLCLPVKDALLLQLIAAFRAEYWWMPVWLACRRLLLVTVLISDRSEAVWVWLTACSFCLLALQLLSSPYARSADNALEGLVLLSLSLQTTLLAVWPPPYISPLLVAAFNSLLIAPLLPLLAQLLRDKWAEMKHAAGGAWRSAVAAVLELL